MTENKKKLTNKELLKRYRNKYNGRNYIVTYFCLGRL